MSHGIEFSPEALGDLIDLYDYIAIHDGAECPIGYIDRIEDFCRSLSVFPDRGKRQDDLRGFTAYRLRTPCCDCVSIQRWRSDNPAGALWGPRSSERVSLIVGRDPSKYIRSMLLRLPLGQGVQRDQIRVLVTFLPTGPPLTTGGTVTLLTRTLLLMAAGTLAVVAQPLITIRPGPDQLPPGIAMRTPSDPSFRSLAEKLLGPAAFPLYRHILRTPF